MNDYLETWFAIIGFMGAAYQFYVTLRVTPRIKDLNVMREIMFMDAQDALRRACLEDAVDLGIGACSMAEQAVRLRVRVLWAYLFLMALTTIVMVIGVVSAFR